MSAIGVIYNMKRILLSALMLLAAALAAQAQHQGLLISELLFQPPSGEAEYVELYNHGDATVQLEDYHIVRVLHDTLAKHYPLPPHSLAPGAYVVLSKDIASVMACYTVRDVSTLVECGLPTYPNDGGGVALCTADSVLVDRLDYTPDMHSRLLRNKAGVSLERRSFDRPTAEKSNWYSASSLAGYGTPGYVNSQSTECLVEEVAFALASTFLSPDGDGYQDEAEITFTTADEALMARVEVYDPRGRMVRRLLNNGLLGTHGTIVWDGRDEAGVIVPRGQYVINILVYDLGGERQTLRRVVAVL